MLCSDKSQPDTCQGVTLYWSSFPSRGLKIKTSVALRTLLKIALQLNNWWNQQLSVVTDWVLMDVSLPPQKAARWEPWGCLSTGFHKERFFELYYAYRIWKCNHTSSVPAGDMMEKSSFNLFHTWLLSTISLIFQIHQNMYLENVSGLLCDLSWHHLRLEQAYELHILSVLRKSLIFYHNWKSFAFSGFELLTSLIAGNWSKSKILYLIYCI